MSFEPREYLRHIQVEAEYLLKSCAGLKLEDFLADETLRRAAVRSLEIIGEASKKVPEEFRKDYLDIAWRAMSGMRDRLIPDYFGVDYELVWDIVQNRIPILQHQLSSILDTQQTHSSGQRDRCR
jgi:uncharacterized protein with HEPN domain